jgi:hypothetical protein
MSYLVYIQRIASDITLEEWLLAAARIEGVRQHSGPSHILDPLTKKRVPITYSGGELDLLLPNGEWSLELNYRHPERWSPGLGVFELKDGHEDPADAVRIVVAKMARILEAEIVGSLGEEFDWSQAEA